MMYIQTPKTRTQGRMPMSSRAKSDSSSGLRTLMRTLCSRSLTISVSPWKAGSRVVKLVTGSAAAPSAGGSATGFANFPCNTEPWMSTSATAPASIWSRKTPYSMAGTTGGGRRKKYCAAVKSRIVT